MLWQKFVVEWSAQVWRFLWASRAAPLSALPEKITWQRVVFIAVLLVAVAALVQVFSLDLAFVMAGDVAFYCEIAAAVMFVVASARPAIGSYSQAGADPCDAPRPDMAPAKRKCAAAAQHQSSGGA